MFSREPNPSDAFDRAAAAEVQKLVSGGRESAGSYSRLSGQDRAEAQREQDHRLHLWGKYMEYAMAFIDDGYAGESGIMAQQRLTNEIAATNRLQETSGY